MPPKKRSSTVRNLTLFLLFAITAQLGYLIYSNMTVPPEVVATGINKEVENLPDPRQREQRRVQVAVRAYAVSNKRPPETLSELVPQYLDSVPTDPKTGKVFTYFVEGDKFTVGADADEPVSQPAPAADIPNARKDIAVDAKKKKDVLAAIAEDPNAKWVYDPTGKRDPFLPTDVTFEKAPDSNAPPLCRFALGQLKLTAVLEGFNPTRAIIETSDGKGHMVQPGTRIGLPCGEIVTIDKERIVILETEVDAFEPENVSKMKRRQVELALRTKDKQEKAN